MKLGKRLGQGVFAGAVLLGCLSRPVVKQDPTTKTNFTAVVRQQAVDKVDILLDIDNSRSMSDKQQILAKAVPDLVNRLITPNCVSEADPNQVTGVSDPTKAEGQECPSGSKAEFKPVTDLHLGIVTSSMGGFGGDVCKADEVNPNNSALNGHNDDKGHLVNRSGANVETPVTEASPSNFLSWFPPVSRNTGKSPSSGSTPFTDATKLNAAFSGMVVGVDQYGCGLEAQMESWYHFLIAPDPYAQIIPDPKDARRRVLDGIDADILKQRHDFLRPDSLVAVIVLTDEDDSSVDPLAVGGQGWAYMNSTFPGSTTLRADGRTTTAPKGTSVCDSSPASADCTSCGFAGTCNAADAACAKLKADPNCAGGGYYGAADDDLNVRMFHMKARYGVDPQYPIKRYTNGLTQYRIPDRKNEHNSAGGYVGTASCTNPLFAQSLPTAPTADLCNLARGPRSPDLVFFAHIGGVPNTLLHFDPIDPEKSKLTSADWVKILGTDPLAYNYDGIDPHMIQSVTPRAGLQPPSSTMGDNGTDPVNGREWDTAKIDLQYACTFPLDTPKDCTKDPSACDCDGTKNPPLCGTTPKTQTRAKAYPTVRELEVAHAMGDQGIAASLCPIHTTELTPGDPLFGYRPAVKAIVDRLKNALANQCLPQPLVKDDTGKAPCLILETLGVVGPESDCLKYPGLVIPADQVLTNFRKQQVADQGDLKDGGIDMTKFPVCQVNQLIVAPGDSCAASGDPGWCYVVNTGGKAPAGTCPQAILFSPTGNPQVGAKISLQCIEQAGTASVDGG